MLNGSEFQKPLPELAVDSRMEHTVEHGDGRQLRPDNPSTSISMHRRSLTHAPAPAPPPRPPPSSFWRPQPIVAVGLVAAGWAFGGDVWPMAMDGERISSTACLATTGKGRRELSLIFNLDPVKL